MEPSSRRSFHIGRYHCTETLVQGPLGETFRAKVYGVAGLEKQYALKQVDAMLRVDPEIRQRLVEAARAYASLEHDRIARLTEIVDEAETLFFVTELSRGIDLPRLVAHLRSRDEALPVEQALLIAYDVAEALEVAQRPSEAAPHGVPHLGLQPSTVSVLGEGEVRVADFALAGALERPGWTEEDALVPLLTYTAPERLRGGPATAASDVWSVGAMLYELCAGTPPWSGASAAALIAARARPPSWDKLASRPGLRELLERLLADDPTARPQTATLLREDLAAALGLELTRARVGLQGLVKRALGRTTTRTGSFAAVAIPSASMPTLAPEPTPFPSSPTGRVTLGGLALKKVPTPVEPVEAKPRAWAPPRTTGMMAVVRPDEPSAHEPAQMELAELPPAALSEATVTERSIDAVAFDDVMTAPETRFSADQLGDPLEPKPEEKIEVLEADALELEEVYDAPTRPGPIVPPSEALPSGRMATLQGTGPEIAPMLDGAPVAAVAVPVAPAPHIAPPVASPVATPPPSPSPPPPPSASRAAPAPRSTSLAWIVGGLVGVSVAGAVMLFVENRGTQPAPLAQGPTIEAPKAEPPKAEPPKVEPPKVEAPKVEPPKVEAPKVEPPKVEAPKVEPPKVAAVAGKLAISTVPDGASVWIDGELRGTTPLSTTAAAGKHRVVAVLSGYKLVQKSLDVEAQGASLALTLDAAKLPSELRGEGGLKVRCRTQGELRILVDGNDTGVNCPNADRISVAPGAHTIGLQSPRTGEVKEVDGDVGDDPDHSTRVYVVF